MVIAGVSTLRIEYSGSRKKPSNRDSKESGRKERSATTPVVAGKSELSRYERRFDHATRAEFGIRAGAKRWTSVVVLALCRPSCPAHRYRAPFHPRRIMREHCVLPPRTRQDLVELEAQTRRAQPPLVYTSLEEISPIRVERERGWIAIDYAPFPLPSRYRENPVS